MRIVTGMISRIPDFPQKSQSSSCSWWSRGACFENPYLLECVCTTFHVCSGLVKWHGYNLKPAKLSDATPLLAIETIMIDPGYWGFCKLPTLLMPALLTSQSSCNPDQEMPQISPDDLHNKFHPRVGGPRRSGVSTKTKHPRKTWRFWRCSSGTNRKLRWNECDGTRVSLAPFSSSTWFPRELPDGTSDDA